MKKIYKELDFLDEKVSNINLEMITLEKDKNKIEEKKAEITKAIEELEEEKKEILSKTDKYKGLKKYFYMIIQANSDLKNLKIINSKLEENRITLQSVEDKLDIKNQLIKDKLEEKVNVWNRREEIYIGKYKEKENEQESKKETIKKENSKDLNSLITLYNLVTQVNFEEKKATKIKDELMKNLNTNIEKYIQENNIKPPSNFKNQNNKRELESEC